VLWVDSASHPINMNYQQENFTISVSALTQKITQLLKTGIGSVSVSGEISGLTIASSGHRYFTLKDEGAQIDCVLWSSRSVDQAIANGMMVIVRGNLSIYAIRGKYQIDCQEIAPLGQGDLYLAFEALKQDLAARRFFDMQRKRLLPDLPLRIGVVTSATGAAVQDILSTLKRRSPHCTVYLCPATVQGEVAPAEIAAAIVALNQTDADVMIVGRGGGSLEDLWAFNTAIVAQAIYDSTIPIISAVGHETDFTIADFVADFRAATPTAAAELVTQRHQQELIQLINQTAESLYEAMLSQISQQRQQLDGLSRSYAFYKFSDRLQNYIQQVDDAETSLQTSIQRHISNAKAKLTAIASHTKSLHPLSPLRRGFALLQDDSRLIGAHESLQNRDRILIIRQDEVAYAKIDRVSLPTEALPQDFCDSMNINQNLTERE
jgi:exodeoxyribonuclease VII large subunit